MKYLSYLSFLSVTIFLVACKGVPQPEKLDTKAHEKTSGKPINQLGESVMILFQDSKNNYWFASDGVVKYDGKTLTQYTTEDGLHANRIRQIQEDDLGNIYFNTGEGISRFDGKTIEKLTVSHDSINAFTLKSTDLWFEGDWDENGAYRWDGKHLYHLKLPKSELEAEFYRLNPDAIVEPYAVYSIYRDEDGFIWFGTGSLGPCRFDGKHFFWVSDIDITEIEPGPAMGVRSMVQDRNGDMYFASNINSKYRLQTLNVATTYLKMKGIEASLEEEMDTAFMSITEDDAGNIWMVDYQDGVWKWDGKALTHYPVMDGKKNITLFSIYKDRKGELWLGTHNNGVYRFDGEQFNRFIP